MTASVRYRVSPGDPRAHRFQVRCELTDHDGSPQIFRMPAWLRGSYLVRDFAKHVIAVDARRDGQPVTFRRLDKSRFEVAAGAPGALTLDYAVHAWDESVRKAWLDERRGFFNGSSLFYAAAGHEARSHALEIQRPDAGASGHWRVATAMTPGRIDADGFGEYLAEDYEALIDHPLELGEFQQHAFDVDGIPHALVLAGRTDADVDVARITADLARICSAERTLFGGEPALERYLFLTRVVGSGYGGLEHRASTALICSRSDLPCRDDRSRDADYHRFLGLCSHEYFHLWNVKRITAQAFAESDLGREAYTRDLWHYEGVTSYYDDLMLLRAGVIDAATYLDLLAETATRLQRSPARHVQTLEDASFETWIKFYQPDDNTQNQATNYYVKGALVALCVDLQLRLSGSSLDAVMRLLWQRYGREGVPLPEGTLERTANECAGGDLSAFFARALRGTDDLPLTELLAPFGVRAELRAQTSAIDNGGRTASQRTVPFAGLKLRAGTPMVAWVSEAGPAQRAGLAAGDELVALDGLKLTAANWLRRLEALTPDSAARIDYFRGDELRSAQLTLQPAPADTWTLTLDEALASEAPEGTDPQAEARLRRRREWLGA